jgi:uncharacterized protein GlcG (DUF336 family)
VLAGLIVSIVLSLNLSAGVDSPCADLPKFEALRAALKKAVDEDSSGQNLHMWASIVNRDGIVCAVAFSGSHRAAQLPGSRVISAQKAYTANAFSLDGSSASDGSGASKGIAVSTANIYATVLPGGTDYGLEHSNPVHVEKAYAGHPRDFGSAADPMVGQIIGGVNVFGGGLALYDATRKIVGGLGLSGDTSCTDHFIAWRMRHYLALDYLSGVEGSSQDPLRPDNIIFDMSQKGLSASGFGHPTCFKAMDPKSLSEVR